MSVELLQTLSTVFFALAAVLFLISLALFFILDVVRLVGDVTGSTARRAIENIRKGNEVSGDKAYKPSPVNKARGKLTDKISPSGQLVPRTGSLGVATGTAKLKNSQQSFESDKTLPLDTSSDETSVLSDTASETTVLSQNSNETTVLSQAPNESASVGGEHKPSTFALELEMSFIGSAELIE